VKHSSNYYKPSRYKSEALPYGHSVATLLNPRGVASFPQVQSNSCKTCNSGSGCSFYRTLPPNYKIKMHYLRLN
jgi:hypothetical protein